MSASKNISEGFGYALPAAAPTASPAAALFRAASISGDNPTRMLPPPRRVVDQGEVPCCVSCAMGAAMEILHPDWPPLAPLFHYYLTRFERDGADANGLLFLSNAFAVLEQLGICQFDAHPYLFTMTDAIRPPDEAARDDGRLRRLPRISGPLARYRAIGTLSRADDIRNQLRQGRPVLLGIELPQGYIDLLRSHGEWTDETLPPAGTGHCLLAIGYDDTRLALKIQDSFGEGFAALGCWWMAYRVVDSAFVKQAYYLIP